MKTISTLALAAILVIFPSISTITPADTIPSLLEKYIAEYPVEKVYVHTDRNYYAPGEQIWLKSYTVAGSLNQPSPISNNIHLELIAPDKSLVSSALLYSEKGFANGNFQLPDSIKNGTYLIRAYTSWMQNFGEDYFFQKEIEVLGGLAQEPVPAKDSPSTVQILPEGGQLVVGVPSRVAIYSDLDTFQLVDNTGNKLTDVATTHNRMGLFGITPQAGINYSLVDKNGNKYNLPQPMSTGFTIEARPNLQDMVKITLRSNAATTNKEKMLLLVHSGGLISYALDVDLSNQISILNLPKENMPEGISHITLFNKNNLPVAERLVFVKKELITQQIKLDKNIYNTRDKVTLDLTVTYLNGTPVQGNFSLAALDIAQLPSGDISENIKSNLLLSADLKGKIETPAYYFSDNSPEVNENLDLLMMTKGWSRFTWQDVLQENYPSIQYLIEKGINVKGRIIDKFNGKPIEKGKVTYFDNQMNPPFIDQLEANDEGFFIINNIAAYNDHIVTFQGANKKGKGQQYIGFDIQDSIYYEEPNLWSPPSTEPLAEQTDVFVEKSKERALIDESYDFDTTATRLDDVVVEGLRNVISQEQSAYGPGDVTFSYEDVQVGQKVGRTPLDIIQGKVSGVQITGMGFSQSVTIRGGMSGFSAGASPAFYLNDVPTDLATILAMPATAIERVEIFKGPSAAIFGANGATGVMVFYTYTGGGYQKPTEGMYTTVLKNAYQGKREFFAPDYSEELPEHIKPDRRVLVHWAPSIITNESGKATVEFYTTDLETTIQLDIQGLSNNGKPLATTKYIEVEKR